MQSSLWLLPTVQLSVVDCDAVFFDGFTQLRIAKLGAAIQAMSRWLDGDHGERLLQNSLGAQLVDMLDRRGWIVRLERPLSETTKSRPLRTRQLSYFAHVHRTQPDRAFRDLESSRVLIIGTGGIGSYAAFHLLASGARHLILNDPDTVEISNLNRQILFSEHDVGQPKVHALRAALNARFEDPIIEALPRHLDRGELRELAQQVDLVLLCGEHPGPLDHPEVIRDRAIISAGYFGCEAFAGPVVSPAHGTPRWDQVIRARERSARSNLEQAREPLIHHWNSSGSTINAMGGALLAEAAVRLLAPSLGGPILLMTRRFIQMRDLTVRDEVMHGART